MKRGVPRCLGWAVERQETGEGAQEAIGQEKGRPIGEAITTDSGTHTGAKAAAKHVNMQVNYEGYLPSDLMVNMSSAPRKILRFKSLLTITISMNTISWSSNCSLNGSFSKCNHRHWLISLTLSIGGGAVFGCQGSLQKTTGRPKENFVDFVK